VTGWGEALRVINPCRNKLAFPKAADQSHGLFRTLLLLAGVSLIITLSYPSSVKAEQILDRIVAVVDDDIILFSELQQRLQQEGYSDNPDPSEYKTGIVHQILERMISEKIQLQLAERIGLSISNAEVRQILENIARTNNSDARGLAKTMQKRGYSYAGLQQSIKRQLLLRKLRQHEVDRRIRIDDREIHDQLRIQKEMNTRYHLQHILLSTPESADAQTLENAKAQAFELVEQLREGAEFATLAQQYSASSSAQSGGDLGWRSRAQLPTLFDSMVPKMFIGQIPDPIKSATGWHIIKLIDVRSNTAIISQVHLRHIIIRVDDRLNEQMAQEQAQMLFEQLKGNADFKKLAQDYSDDPVSAQRGGDLGWISIHNLPPGFPDTLANAKKSSIVGPFRSPYGWHVVEVLDRRERQTTEEDMWLQIENLITQEKLEEHYALWVRKLRDNAFVEYRLP